MLERVQSAFLFVVAICMFVAIFLPVWSKENPSTQEKAHLTYLTLTYSKATKTVSSQTTIYMTILAALASGVALFSIMSYRNRLRQMQLGLLNSLLMAIVMGLIVYFSKQGEQLFAQPQYGTYFSGFYAVIGALISNLLANRFIRRDERMVRSAERMR